MAELQALREGRTIEAGTKKDDVAPATSSNSPDLTAPEPARR
jgi:hypothetical protein